jgi:hypothetical protein
MKKQLLIATSLVLVSGVAFAANDGSPGATSQGDTTITLNNSQRVIVAGIEDISADTATYGGSGDFDSAWMNFCIGQNTGFDVDVTFVSTNATAGNAYFVEDGGATDTVGYTVTFADDTGGGGTNTTVDGSGTDTVIAAAPVTQEDLGCGTDNVSMLVTFNGTDLGAATAASYTDVLTITVAPN